MIYDDEHVCKVLTLLPGVQILHNAKLYNTTMPENIFRGWSLWREDCTFNFRTDIFGDLTGGNYQTRQNMLTYIAYCPFCGEKLQHNETQPCEER